MKPEGVIVKARSKVLLLILAASLVGLSGCSEWKVYTLEQPATKQRAVCATNRSTLNDEQNQRLHQCISACESKGFVLASPESVPRPGELVASAVPPSIPIACR